jgi:hypothetical protein
MRSSANVTVATSAHGGGDDFDHTSRIALRAFKNCIANRFTRLRRLQYVFYLPVETMLDEVDLDWFHLGHDAVHQHVDKVLLLYTSPDLFHQQRHLYNHVCEQTPTSNETMEHLQWTLDCDPSSIDDTLTHLQRVHSLSLYADIQVHTRRVNHSDAHRVRSPRRYLRPESDQRARTIWATRDTDEPSMCRRRTVASVCSCSRVPDVVVA